MERCPDWILIKQAYLFVHDGYTVRVRLNLLADESGNLTGVSAFLGAKGPRIFEKREEYETEIPPAFASKIIDEATFVVVKKRHSMLLDGLPWEIDVFEGMNLGIVIAEIEIANSTTDSDALMLDDIELPDWIGREIINEPQFDNENLAVTPFATWSERS